MVRPLGPSEQATVLRSPLALSKVWSYETVAVAEGAARTERAAKKRVNRVAMNIMVDRKVKRAKS